MKEVTKEVTRTEVAYYEAADGTHFYSKEECVKYEESAKCVVAKEIEKYRLAQMNEYELYDGAGSEEYDIDVYHIENAEVLEKLNIFRNLCDCHVPIIGEEFIGKTILLAWDYDKYSSYNLGTIDDLLGRMRKAYTEAITPKEEEKEN